MAKIVLLNQFLSINGNDLSTYTTKAELMLDSEAKEVTTYGSASWKEFLGGLRSAKLNVEFQQDFAAGLLDALMFPLLGTVVTFITRPTQAAVSTSNPNYTGSILISEWNPLTGKVGDDATVKVAYPTSGVVTRATA